MDAARRAPHDQCALAVDPYAGHELKDGSEVARFAAGAILNGVVGQRVGRRAKRGFDFGPRSIEALSRDHDLGDLEALLVVVAIDSCGRLAGCRHCGQRIEEGYGEQ